LQLFGSAKQAKGNGQVERSATFPDISRGKVYHHTGTGHFVAIAFNGTFYPHHAFLNGAIGQANHYGNKLPLIVYIHLNGYGYGIYTMYGAAVSFYEHRLFFSGLLSILLEIQSVSDCKVRQIYFRTNTLIYLKLTGHVIGEVILVVIFI
jgi:hypothetical protein